MDTVLYKSIKAKIKKLKSDALLIAVSDGLIDLEELFGDIEEFSANCYNECELLKSDFKALRDKYDELENYYENMKYENDRLNESMYQ